MKQTYPTALKATAMRWLIAFMALIGSLGSSAHAIDPNVGNLQQLRCLGLPGQPVNPLTGQRMVESEISSLIPDPCAWYAQTFNTIGPNGLNIFYLAANVGLLLVVVGLVLNVLKDGLSGNTSKMGPAVIRAAIASFVISQTATLQTTAYTTFMTAYTASEAALGQQLENTMQQATTGFLTNVNTIANLSFVGKGFAWAIQGAKFLGAGSAAERTTGDNTPTDGEAFKAIWLITIPYMAVYAVTMYGFILTFILFAAALPMAAGWMSFGGSSKLLVTNIMALVGATFGIMFLPVSFNIGVNIAYVQPMNKMNAIATEYEAKRAALLTDANKLDAEARGEFDKLMNGETDVEPKQWYDRLGDSIRDKFQNLAAPIKELALYAEKAVKQGIYGLALTFFGCLIGVTVMTMVPAIAMRAFVGYSGGTGGGASPRTGGMTGMGRGANGGKSAGSSAGSTAGAAARSIGATAAARLGAGAVAQAGNNERHKEAMGALNSAMGEARAEREQSSSISGGSPAAAQGGSQGGSDTKSGSNAGTAGAAGVAGGKAAGAAGAAGEKAAQGGKGGNSASETGENGAPGTATSAGAATAASENTEQTQSGSAGGSQSAGGSAGGSASGSQSAGGSAGGSASGSASGSQSAGGSAGGSQSAGGSAGGSQSAGGSAGGSQSAGGSAESTTQQASGASQAGEAGGSSAGEAGGSSAGEAGGSSAESGNEGNQIAESGSNEGENIAPSLSGNSESAEDTFAASREHARTGAELKQAEQAYDYAQENRKNISPEQFRAAKSNYEQALNNHQASRPAQQSEVQKSARALATATLNEEDAKRQAGDRKAALAVEEKGLKKMREEKASKEIIEQQQQRVQAAKLKSEQATAAQNKATSERKNAEENYRTSTNGAYMVKGAVGGRRAVAAVAAAAISGGRRAQAIRQNVKDNVQRVKGHPEDIQGRAKQAAFEATVGKAQRYTPSSERSAAAMAPEQEEEVTLPRSAGRR